MIFLASLGYHRALWQNSSSFLSKIKGQVLLTAKGCNQTKGIESLERNYPKGYIELSFQYYILKKDKTGYQGH